MSILAVEHKRHRRQLGLNANFKISHCEDPLVLYINYGIHEITTVILFLT